MNSQNPGHYHFIHGAEASCSHSPVTPFTLPALEDWGGEGGGILNLPHELHQLLFRAGLPEKNSAASSPYL